MSPSTIKAPVRKVRATTGGGTGYEARTILFNDDHHTFEEVARQLMKAIRCSYEKGMGLANLVHNLGSTVVYSGHTERCEAVASVLEEIGLRTNVER